MFFSFYYGIVLFIKIAIIIAERAEKESGGGGGVNRYQKTFRLRASETYVAVVLAVVLAVSLVFALVCTILPRRRNIHLDTSQTKEQAWHFPVELVAYPDAHVVHFGQDVANAKH